MAVGSCCRWSPKNVGQCLRLMSVWALSPRPRRIWQEQSQAGVTASIHLVVSCSRGGDTNPSTIETVHGISMHSHICHTHTQRHTQIQRKKKKTKINKLRAFLAGLTERLSRKKAFCSTDFLQMSASSHVLLLETNGMSQHRRVPTR